jgi:dephospho-CoA kinase
MATKKSAKKIVLGFVGEMACGKGTAAAYCKKKYNADTFRFSTILRETLDRVYLPHTREIMVTLSEILRKNFGEDLLARAMAEDVKKAKKSFIAIDGIRRPADIIYLEKLPEFHLIAINVQAKTRFERLTNRRENKDDQTKTWAQFQGDAKRPTEKTIRVVAKKAEFVIDNNGSFPEFYKQIDAIVHQIKK